MWRVRVRSMTVGADNRNHMQVSFAMYTKNFLCAFACQCFSFTPTWQ